MSNLSPIADESIQTRNPFEVTSQSKAQAPVMGSALNSGELGRIQAKIVLAKQFPRDQDKAYTNIKKACTRLEFALKALYAYTKGGSSVSGASIRLAEEIVRHWGNIDCGWHVVEQTQTQSVCRAYATDYESNITKDIIFIVSHYRDTKKGRYLLKADRDIYEIVASQASRRVRNCILTLIPSDIVDMSVETCEKTMNDKCDMSQESIKKLIDAFAAFGVTKEDIEARIQRNLEAISPGQVVQFRKIYQSLKDGMSGPEDWFEKPLPESSNGTLSKAEKLKEKMRLTATESAEDKQQETIIDIATSEYKEDK